MITLTTLPCGGARCEWRPRRGDRSPLDQQDRHTPSQVSWAGKKPLLAADPGAPVNIQEARRLAEAGTLLLASRVPAGPGRTLVVRPSASAPKPGRS